jgi:hypothetical protein
MSPLLGSIGGASEYAYRGTLDDWPNDFQFTSLTNQEPGGIYTSGITTITGINYNAKVSISGDGSFSVNGGAFNTAPKFIRNNDYISIRIATTSGTSQDFNKNYISTITVGKKSSSWGVSTRILKDLPTNFDFNDLVNQNVSIAVTSNTVKISGLDNDIPYPIRITSGIGSISINEQTPVYSGTVLNDDNVYVVTRTADTYSTKNTSDILVGYYVTDFSTTTRPVDLVPNQFSFVNQTNVGFSTVVTSNTITLTGIDTGQFTLASISPNTFDFNVTDSSGNVLYPFTPFSKEVTNQNRITLRTTSSNLALTTKTATFSVSGVSSTFSVTTKDAVPKTVPNQFSFTDRTNLPLNTLIESNEIILTGITTGSFGTASITNGEYLVTRNGIVVQNYTNQPSQVTVFDGIKLRKTSSVFAQESLTATFQVSGIDNTIDLEGLPAVVSDDWTIRTRDIDCLADSKTLTSVSNAEPNTLQSISFISTGFDVGCNMKVSTSNANSYLEVVSASGSRITGTSNLTVNPDEVIVVYMQSSSNYSETRTTTINLKSDNISQSTSFNWSVSTGDADCIPTGTPLTLGPGARCLTLVNDVNVNSYSYLRVPPRDSPSGSPEHTIRFDISEFDTTCGIFDVSGSGIRSSISNNTLSNIQKSLNVTLITPTGFSDQSNYQGDSYYDLSLFRRDTSPPERVFGPVRFLCRTCTRTQYEQGVNVGCYTPMPSQSVTITHFYDDVNGVTTSLTYSFPVINVIAVRSGSSRYYDITFNGAPFSSSVVSFSLQGANGGSQPSMRLKYYAKISSSIWRLAFERLSETGSYVESFNRQFTVSVTY